MDTKRIRDIIQSIPSQKTELLNALIELKEDRSFREIGEILGIDHAVIPKIINGKKNVSIETLAGYIATLLDSES
jgi:plasmid maintenance system antidote protein VapI